MTASIIIVAVVITAITACRVTKHRVKDFIPSGGLRFFIGFVIFCLLLYLNRYSILALVVVLHKDYSFGEALKTAFPMKNDMLFFMNTLEKLIAEAGNEIPVYLKRSLESAKAGTSDFVTVVGDLVDLVIIAW